MNTLKYLLTNVIYTLNLKQIMVDGRQHDFIGLTISDKKGIYVISAQSKTNFTGQRVQADINLNNFAEDRNLRKQLESNNLSSKSFNLEENNSTSIPKNIEVIEGNFVNQKVLLWGNTSISLITIIRIASCLTIISTTLSFIYTNPPKNNLSYCGVNKPDISEENFYIDKPLSRQRKFLFSYLLPTNLLNTKNYIICCALKKDPHFLKDIDPLLLGKIDSTIYSDLSFNEPNSLEIYFNKELFLINIYNDFVFYNSKVGRIFTSISQVSCILLISNPIRLLIFKTLQHYFYINIESVLVKFTVLIFSGIIAKQFSDFLKMTLGLLITIIFFFISKLKNLKNSVSSNTEFSPA